MTKKVERPWGCSDGGCIFGHIGGMHTNGGCRCAHNIRRQPNFETVKDLTILIRGRTKYIEYLEEMLEPFIEDGTLNDDS